MPTRAIERTVAFCTDHARLVVVAALTAATAACIYAAQHFAITTDVTQLIAAKDSAWFKNQLAYQAEFPTQAELPSHKIMVVLDAPTPELADQAADKLAQSLSAQSSVIQSMAQPGGGPFFERNALLFLQEQDVAAITSGLSHFAPLLRILASDPSLRGIAGALSFVTAGVQSRRIELGDLARPLTFGADTLSKVLAGSPASFSWRFLMQGRPAKPEELRRYISVDPKLDFSALEPGRAATDAIRQTAADLKLASDFDVRMRLTGQVPMNDEEFGSLRKSAPATIAGTIITVLIILFLALRSWRIIGPVAFALIVGFCATAAIGLLVVGKLNLISIAFAVLFIGLGVDFGLQFSVRYRSERHNIDDLPDALRSSAKKAGMPLALAAAATTCAFFSFLPTGFRGLSELGEIAGIGMLIAFFTTITVLPAALRLSKPPAEPRQMGFERLAPIDRFTMAHRIPILIVTLAIVLGASPLLRRVQFDFNPLHLQNPDIEAVAAFLDLKSDPNTGANAINILAPSLGDAKNIAARLATLPQVSRTQTIETFIPDVQDRKLAEIANARFVLDPVLTPKQLRSAPTDAEIVRALKSAAAALSQAANEATNPGAIAAARLAGLLNQLAAADQTVRAWASAAFAAPLLYDLDQLHLILNPQRITLQILPDSLARDWMAPDGKARVEVLPKGDSNNDAVLRNFASAVLAVEPAATGTPVMFQEAARIIVRAFVEAAALALASITIILLVALRRIGDVLLTLVPLIVAGLVTLEICGLIGLQLNFANIIALPLLLGVGVAFKIYYIMAWRSGKTNLLESTLTRAVIFSAMTTATAFGSLWLSNEPGISSMGRLMALSLACTLSAAVLFQPILMGPPRTRVSHDETKA
jgi:hopanoid biosynthesis associated RND transporter like protein HpnN